MSPKKIVARMKTITQLFHAVSKLLGAQISQGPNFLGLKFLGAQISQGPKKSGAQMRSGTISVIAKKTHKFLTFVLAWVGNHTIAQWT